MRDIQMYERRIQNLIDGVGVLKERLSRDDKMRNQDPADQLRSDIDSSLLELEQLQENHAHRLANRPVARSRSPSPSSRGHQYRSLSADAPRRPRTKAQKVSFQDDPMIDK